MNSKSLPSSFKHDDYRKKAIKNNKTISSGHHGSLAEVIKNEKSFNSPYSSSFSSSHVRVSSPLTRQTFLNNSDIQLYNISTISDKSWATYGWSTLSGSLTTQRRKLKKQLTKSWNNRRTRRTFPPSKDLLKKEKKKFSFTSSLNRKTPSTTRKYRHTQPNNKNRQSLQDILSQFTAYEEAMKNANNGDVAAQTTDKTSNNDSKSISRKSKLGSMSLNITNTVTSYSSLSKRLEKALKKNGKRRYRRKNQPPSLFILKNDEGMKPSTSNPYFIFQPPTTVSSQSSTPITPLKFPTPPKRFSAYYVDLEGNLNKTEYKRPLNIMEESTRILKKFLGVLPIQQKSKEDVVYKQLYNQQLVRNLSLFVFGFLFFPFWWLGTLIYISRKKELLILKKQQQDQQLQFYLNEFDLMSLHTFGYLNIIFSCMSLVFIAIVVALFFTL